MTASDYQRIRLWSGITSIGMNLGAVTAVGLSSLWWGNAITAWGETVAVFLLIAIALGAMNLPLDLLAGHAVERGCGRTGVPLRVWLRDWAAGRLWASAGLFFGMLFFWGARGTGADMIFLLVAAAVSAGAVFFLPGGNPAPEGGVLADFESRVAGELKALGIGPVRLLWTDLADAESVSGYFRPAGRREFVLSESAAAHLTAREVALMIARDMWLKESGRTTAGAVIAWLWLVAGLGLAVILPTPSAVAGALCGIAVFTFWCFLALFVWPPLNRRWALKADRHLGDRIRPEEARALLEKIQRLNATDTDLPPAKKTVFHPLPPLRDRLEILS